MTNSLLEPDFYEVFNILFLSENKLEINGKIYNQAEERMVEKTIEINFDHRETDRNIVGKTLDEFETGEYINGRTYSIKIINEIEYTVRSNIFLFNLYGKNVLFNLDNIIPEYSYANIIVLYNKVHNNYFIAIDNLGRSE